MTRKSLFLILSTLLIIATSTSAFHAQGNCTRLNSSSKVQSGSGSLSYVEQQIVALVNGSRAYDYDLELEKIAYEHYAFRSGGSPGAEEAAYWIKEQFESFGLDTWLEPFEFTTWDLSGKPSLLTDDDGNLSTTDDQVSIQSFQSMHLSWPTLGDGVFADLVVLPLPEAANRGEIGMRPINQTAWAVDITGKILLIGREVRWSGTWFNTFFDKIYSQPPAALIYTWWYDWMSFTSVVQGSAEGRAYWGMELPLGYVNYEDGLLIRDRENTMNVSAFTSIKAVISTGAHYNVVGRITGYEDPEKMIIISSHYDTIMASGFCDNGAGTAGVLEIAEVITNAVQTGFYKPKYTLLFVPFASEEFWLVGSINYVRMHKSEMPNIVAVINLDCIGSDDFYVTETNSVNGFDLDQIVLNAAQDIGIMGTLEPPGGADQEAFRDPSWSNELYLSYWGLDANISDATPVESSVLLDSYPLFYSDLWDIGAAGWIHTSYDNSTSTGTLSWVEEVDLENHIKVAALTAVRVSPNTVIIVPDNYSTIQGAINNADEGDTIFVKNNIYHENVVVNKTVTLIGENRSNTIIDGSGTGSDTVRIAPDTDNVRIEDFTIQNGDTPIEPVSLRIVNSKGHTIRNNIIRQSYHGIRMQNSNDSYVINNVIANNTYAGVYFSSSSHNSLIGNLIENNPLGAWLADISCINNTFYHNNFVHNSLYQVRTFAPTTRWDSGYPSGGNYWSNYTGIDEKSGPSQDLPKSDGIGDTKHTIDTNITDDYPLMTPINKFSAGTWKGDTYNIDILSNSTIISNFQIDKQERTISFNVTGATGLGFCRVTIPNTIVEDMWGLGNYKVVVDGVPPLDVRNWTDAENTYIYFTYLHSEHQVVIMPEIPSVIILLLTMVFTSFAVILTKKKHLPS